jgi:imidazolonepropionase
VPVALATDCNPGSSYTESMPMVLVLAVFELGLSIEESLTAATLNAACCLGLGAETGSIEPGKRADLVLLDTPNLLHVAYHYGVNPVAAVVKGGRLAWTGGDDPVAGRAVWRRISTIPITNPGG